MVNFAQRTRIVGEQSLKVTYDMQRQTIEANGNVIAVNELIATQRANSMAFRIEDGQVAPLR
jgi:hypothetical protein